MPCLVLRCRLSPISLTPHNHEPHMKDGRKGTSSSPVLVRPPSRAGITTFVGLEKKTKINCSRKDLRLFVGDKQVLL